MLRDFSLMEISKLVVLMAAILGAAAFFYPSFPRLLRIQTKRLMKHLGKWPKRVMAFVVIAGGIVWACITVKSDWEKFKTEHESDTAKLQRSAEVLAGQLEVLQVEWEADENAEKRGVEQKRGSSYYRERYKNDFKSRVMETVESLGKHGKWSITIEAPDCTDSGVLKNNAKEIRRLANELKD